MEKIFINGGNPLHGEVTVSGAKNAVVAILPEARQIFLSVLCREPL